MKTETLIILGAAGGLLAWFMVKGAGGVAQSVGTAVVDTGTGFVYGIGDGIGIPRTNMTQCQKDIADGKTWDASFSCPAGTFLKSLFN